ncbi:MAG TPA: polysaccharide biosynthesis tyrosine autokinase [Mucilaginibacter sp.]|jgi:capsular exopolysaccharide synthesis family protein
MEENNKPQPKLLTQEVDYFKIGKIILSRWYWILGSVAICLIIANVYLWYTPKTYATSGTLKFEEKKSEIQDLVGIPGNNDRPAVSKIQSETIVLQSTPLLLSAVKHLDYRISFFIVGRVLNRTNDLYPVKPLNISLLKFDTLNFFNKLITFKPINKSSFSIGYENSGIKIQRIIHYNVPFTIGPTAFSIQYPGDIPKTSAYLFKLNTAEEFVDRIRGGLRTNEVVKNSNIMSLQETDANPQFAADILNSVMKEYLNYDRNRKTQSASQMIQFIDSQLDYLAGQVKGSENSLARYKQTNKMTDLSSASEIILGKAKEIESQHFLLKTQLNTLNDLKDEIIQGKDNVNLNFNMGGVMDPELDKILLDLNDLISQKISLLKTYNNNSQPILDLNQQILRAKNYAINSINTSIVFVKNQIKYLEDQLLPVNQQIAALPSAQRDIVSLERDYEINNKVYSFLSEKKLDAQINSAGILSGATIIDVPHASFSPVSPDGPAIRRTAVILGLAIGFGAIVLIRLLNTNIYDRETVESLTTIPIIGVIRKFPEELDEFSSRILAITHPKSLFAESVRSVRTNLNFLAPDKKTKVICVTSEVAGEGKSFVAINLSSTLSLIDKKVILIAADLRRSKMHRTFDSANDIGLSNYLACQCSIEDIITNSSQKNLDFITSGPVPPNPSELLHSERMAKLVAELKLTYEFIMIDTAPIGLVSDAIPLIRMSDINLFVIRSGKSKFNAATIPQRVAQEYHLENTVIVVNAFAEDILHSRYYTTKFTGESHGSRYYYYSDYSGYQSSGYYIDDKKKIWRFFSRWFK